MHKLGEWLSSVPRHAGAAVITGDPHDTFQLLHVLSSQVFFFVVFISCSSNETGLAGIKGSYYPHPGS